MEANLLKNKKGYVVWLICVLFYFYEFLLRTILGTFQGPITQDLQLTPLRFALLSSTAYLLIYGLMQIPVGLIVDKFGLKKSLTCAAIICAFATIGFANSHSFAMAVLFRFFMGLGSSFGFIGLLIAVYDWMPRKNIAMFVGLSQLLGTMGPMVAAGPLNSLAEASIITWRSLFDILGGVGLTCAALIFVLVDKNRGSKNSFIILSRPTAVLKNVWLIVKDPQIWLLALFHAFIYFSLEYLSENECKQFLMTRGFSSGYASYMITLAWLGFALGSPVFGFISDKIMRRKPILLFSAATTFICLSSIIYAPTNELTNALLFFFLGVGIGSSSVCIVLLSEQCKSSYLAAGLGFNNAVTMMFVSIAAPLVGMLLEHLNHNSSNLLQNYHTAFYLLVLCPGLALLIGIFIIKETFGKNIREPLILQVKR